MKEHIKNMIMVFIFGIILIISSILILVFTEEIIIYVILLASGILIFNSGWIWYLYCHLKLHQKIIGVARDSLNQPGHIDYVRRCPGCGRPLANEYQLCPYCGKDFRMLK